MFDTRGVRRFIPFPVVGGLLAILLARWPVGAATAIFALFCLLTVVYFIKSGGRPRFSTRTTLQVTGLIACSIGLGMQGRPWKEVHRYSGHEVNMAISSDGLLVAASQGTSIEIRETQTGRTVQTIKMPAIEEANKIGQRWDFKMQFTNDGKSLMTVDWRPFPCLFDVATGKEIRSWPTLAGGDLAMNAERFVALSSGATGGSEQLKVYHYELDVPLLSFESSTRFRTISSSGSHVLVENANVAELWSIDDQKLVGKVPIPHIPGGIFFVRFSTDGRLLAIPTSTGVAVWDTTECTMITEWAPAGFSRLTALEWSPDGSRLVVSYLEPITPTGNSTRNAIEHCYLLDQNLESIASLVGTSPTFSPTGDRIATVQGGVCISDGENGELLTVLGDSRARVSPFGIGKSILFSYDGNWLMHNGTPTVYRRTRSEFWYSTFQLPAFWGLVLFLTSLIIHLLVSIRVGNSQQGMVRDDSMQQHIAVG